MAVARDVVNFLGNIFWPMLDQGFLAIGEDSESDSEDEDEDFLREIAIEDREHYRAFIPRINNYIETVVVAYNESDFKQHFR